MKKIFFGVLMFIMTLPFLAMSQSSTYDTTAQYLKTKRIPAFKVLHLNSTITDSVWFKNDSLPKDKNIVFIYFSPECGHCEHETEQIVKHIDKLQNAFFVFVSYHEMDKLKAFYDKYDLARFANIRMTRDPQYFIPSFFRVEFTPFVAVYDSKGNFKQAFKQGAEIKELLPLVQ